MWGPVVGYLYDVFEAGRDVGDYCQSGEVVSEQDVIEEFRAYDWPAASLGVLPSGGEVLVNGETLFFAAGVRGPQEHAVDLGGLRVRLVATPVAFGFDFGDGGRARSVSPGSDGDPVAAHRYVSKGEYAASVEVTYAGQYWVDGEGPFPLPGAHTVAGPAVTLTALEARPVLVH